MGLGEIGLKKENKVNIDFDNPNFLESSDETQEIADMIAD